MLHAKASEAMTALEESSTQIRRFALASIYYAGSGHPGGCLSCADIMCSALMSYCNETDGSSPGMGKFILSKGHCAPTLYGAGVLLGRISRTSLPSLRKLGSALQGHPHVGSTPWVETSTGSLGQGFSVAIGMALGYRYRKEATRVYVMLGDGELQEGEIWEGAMFAAHNRLNKLCAIVDYNKMQSDDLNENVIGLESLRAKWEAFNWHVIEIDGHDFDQIESAFERAHEVNDKPTVIIAHTIKGKGVSFMESQPAWHGSVTLRSEELEQALQDLGTAVEDIPAYLDATIWDRKS